jgi:hypothetical protein
MLNTSTDGYPHDFANVATNRCTDRCTDLGDMQ